MRGEILLLALIVGAATYLFRVLPLWMGPGSKPQSGALARILAATGPAAIATLAVASFLPMVRDLPAGVPWPLVAGVLSVPGLFLLTRSVVVATLGGALAYGLVFGLT